VLIRASGLGCILKGIIEMQKTLSLIALMMFSFTLNAASLVGTTVSQCANSAYFGAVTSDMSACDLSTAQLSPSSATVVDPGVEFSLTNSGTRTIDFSEGFIDITYSNVGSSSPDLFIFEFLDYIPTSLSIVSLNVLDITYTFSEKFLGILVGSPLSDGTVTLAVSSVSAVPVPAAAFLFGPALLGFIGLRRRAKLTA
jgi:hypothetical protein